MKCSLFKTIEKRKRTMMTPRVAAIHDMSGFGRCSLTVAIPILSAMGVLCRYAKCATAQTKSV